MNPDLCLLVTLLNGDALLRCAIRVLPKHLPCNGEYLMDPLTREAIRKQLPPHVREIGPIVEVEQIFEVIA